MTLLTSNEQSWWIKACKDRGNREEKAQKAKYR